MKDFFERYSYQSVHLLLNQIAIGLFGVVLSLAAGMAENDGLKIVTSVFSIIFFLFLQFAAAWKVGAEDRVSVDLGKRQKDVFLPFKMWALANSVNYLLAILITLANILPDGGFMSTVGAVASTVTLIVEGMFTGILSISVGGQPLNSHWFIYFLTPLPSLLAVVAAYFCGLNHINFGGLFSANAGGKK